MTIKQLDQAQAVVEELKTQYPALEIKVHLNYHTKLPAITIINEVGGFHFIMHKYDGWKRTGAYIRMEFNATTKSERGFTVSHGFGDDLVKEELPRVNFKRYLEFIKEQAPRIAETIAVV